MKKFLVFVGVLAISSPALAQSVNNKFYAGISGGQSDVSAHKFSQLTYTAYDSKDTSFKIFGGYNLNNMMSAELAHHNLGKATSTVTNDNGISIESKVNAISLALKIAPMSESVISPFAKVGMARLSVKQSTTEPENSKQSKTKLYYGVGAEYVLNKSISLILEYEAFGKMGSTDVESNEVIQVKPTSISAGIKFNF